jgi:uncharacterized membrane protein HdeD (DUF308 family)
VCVVTVGRRRPSSGALEKSEGVNMVRPYQGSQDVLSLEQVDLGALREYRGLFFGLGIAEVVLGALAILLPFIASLITAVVIGWLMIIGGFFQGVHALQSQRWGGRAWAVVGGVVQVIAGALVVAFPLTGTVTLTLVLAAFFLAQGVLKIIRALQHRALPAWGWLMFDGVLSLVLGLLIGLGWPSTAVWALGLLVGINLLFSGVSTLLIGAGAGSLSRART